MNEHIIISKEQAEQIKGRYGKYSAIEPVPTPDGMYIIPERCFNDSDLAAAKAKIQAANGTVQDIIKLPVMGQPCIVGYYLYESENSPLLYCRQAHTRTEHAPETIPNLFTFFRKELEDTVLDWIPNELVKPTWKRKYNGKDYIFIGAAETLTVTGQTPDLVPALWQAVQTEVIIDWYQPTGAHDAFRINTLVRYTNGKVYKSLIDYNTYSPVAYPAGWEWQEGLV